MKRHLEDNNKMQQDKIKIIISNLDKTNHQKNKRAQEKAEEGKRATETPLMYTFWNPIKVLK